MKKLVVILTAVAALALSSTTYANITSAWWAPDGDNAILCPQPGWTNSAPGATSSLLMYGDQYGVPGHMAGQIATDSPLDPTLFLGGTIGNDTGQAWLGYTINVILNKNFSFGPSFPTVDNPPNSDGWFVAALNAPVLQNSGPWNGYWLGTIVYSKGAGSLIGVGQDMDFGYSITFSGAMSFSFVQEMIPSYTNIPEPSAFVLAGIGSLIFALRLRRNRC
jgi:hypothetical protein